MAKFARRVPSRDRSRYLARLLEKSLREQDENLIRSCMAANEDPDAQEIEREFDQIRDRVEEPWNDSPAR